MLQFMARWASGSGAEKPHVWARPLRYHVTQWQGRDVSAANSPHSLLQQHLMLWVPGAGDEQGPVPGAGGGLVSRRLPGAHGEEVGIQWAQDRRGCGGRVCGQKPQGQCGAEQAGGSAASIEGLLTQLCPAPALAAEELSPREQETGPEIHAV